MYDLFHVSKTAVVVVHSIFKMGRDGKITFESCDEIGRLDL